VQIVILLIRNCNSVLYAIKLFVAIVYNQIRMVVARNVKKTKIKRKNKKKKMRQNNNKVLRNYLILV